MNTYMYLIRGIAFTIGLGWIIQAATFLLPSSMVSIETASEDAVLSMMNAIFQEMERPLEVNAVALLDRGV